MSHFCGHHQCFASSMAVPPATSTVDTLMGAAVAAGHSVNTTHFGYGGRSVFNASGQQREPRLYARIDDTLRLIHPDSIPLGEGRSRIALDDGDWRLDDYG